MGLAGQVPGQAAFLLTGQWIIMVLTVVLLLVQIGYYARKWMREETDLGRKPVPLALSLSMPPLGVQVWRVR